MYRIKIFLALFLLFLCCEISSARTVVTRQPYYNPYGNYSSVPYYYPQRAYTPNFTDMSALEEYALNKSYTGESALKRLNRLEMQTFGAIQQGDFDTRYENVRTAILSRPQAKRNKTTILRNVADYFAGQMTGFTPPITSTNYPYYNQQYQPAYGTSSSFETISPWGRRYRTTNYGMTNGTGVRIID